MTGWVSESQRIIAHIREPIPCLHSLVFRNDRIRRNESSQRGIVHASVIESQPKIAGVGILSCAGVALSLSKGEGGHLAWPSHEAIVQALGGLVNEDL